MLNQMKLAGNNPQSFLLGIPTELLPNIAFRRELHSLLAKDVELQKTFLQMCRDEPRIFFNAVAWTLDPRKPVGERNLPFILRPKQDLAIQKIDNCVRIGKDVAIDKTRDEGATKILMTYSTCKFLLVPETVILLGSRAEPLVDKTGDPGTLFAAIDYCIDKLPLWWKALLHLERNFGHYRNLDNSSTIDGEATSIHFGAGKRSTFTIVDELGQVDPGIADNIVFNLSDVGNCNIYNSTHFFGTGHAFYKLLRRDGIEVIKLPWYCNPEKNEGLYKSPKVDFIEVVDKDYYLKKYPDVFANVDLSKPFDNIDFKKKYTEPVFVADGSEKPPIICRSPWHDKEEKERDYRNLCMNVWMYAAGAADMYFDSFVNDRIRSSLCRASKIEGDISYSLEDGRVVLPVFKPEFGKKPFKWWGDLINGLPDQRHNFIIACDIGFGTGNSNSTALIADVNTNELVGEYVTADKDPADFAEEVAALGRWVGGSLGEPYFIWERNGGGGKNFGRRLMNQGFRRVYTDTSEDTKTRKRKNRYGWTSTKQTKDDVLYGLKAALKESLKTQKANKYLLVYSEELINELDTYIFYTSGEADSGEMVDLTSGARARHGDRVIAAALLILGLSYNIPAKIEEKKLKSRNSIGARIEAYEREETENKKRYRTFRYN